MNLSNTTICVPGGNSGVGLSLVRLLANVCKKIFVFDKENKSRYLEKYSNVVYLQIDLSHQKLCNFNENIDILILTTGLMNLGNDTIKNTPYSEIDKAIMTNIRSNLRLFKELDPKKLVILESPCTGEHTVIENACTSFFRTFNEGLEKEGVNTLIIRPFKKTNIQYNLTDKEIARGIIQGILDNSKEVYVPPVFGTVEKYGSILPNGARNAIVEKIMKTSQTQRVYFRLPDLKNRLNGYVNNLAVWANSFKKDNSENTPLLKPKNDTLMKQKEMRGIRIKPLMARS